MAFTGSDIVIALEDNDGTNLSGYTTASHSFSTDRTYYIGIVGDDNTNVSSSNALGTPVTSGVAWTQVEEQGRGTSNISVYKGIVSSPGTVTTAIGFPEVQNACSWLCLEISNASSTVTQSEDIGADGLSVTLTLNNTITTDGLVISFVGTTENRSRNFTVGTRQTAITTLSTKTLIAQYNLVLEDELSATVDVTTGKFIIGLELALDAAVDTINLICDSGSLLFQGTDSILGSPKNSEAASLWFNSDTWHNPTFAADWWTAIPATGVINLGCESGSLLFQGTAVTFDDSQLGTTNLTCDSGSLLFQGTDVTFLDQGTVTTKLVQVALDNLLGANVIDLYRRYENGIYYHFYCIGLVNPYAGKSMWVRTTAGQSAASQALEISTVMYQDGNYDPDLSP